ncbi:MAG: DUF58 domain-containing protein [Planctomycetota bacterium]
MPESSAALDQQVAAVATAYRLSLAGTRHRGRIGQRRGSGPGSSLEFHDFRDYAPGDDLRHVDWSGYARTDQLRVRLHEAEVAPIVEVLLDTSRSMASTDGKLQTLRGLGRALAAWSRAEGSRARVLALGGGEVELSQLVCDGDEQPRAPRAPLRPGSVRVLVTDGLWPHDPAPLLRAVAANASRWLCLQLLDPEERSPSEGPAHTFVDCETGARATLHLDAAALRVYHQRLARLCAGLREQVVRLGGDFASATADELGVVCRRDLLPARVVEPA